MRKIRIFTLFLLFTSHLLAQEVEEETTPAIKAFARNYGTSIALRWSPNTPKLWEAGMQNGYFIFRSTIFKNNKKVDLLETKKLNNTPIKMFPQNVWEVMMDTNRQAELAAIAIFGEGTPTSILPPGIVGNYYTGLESEGRMVYALMAADMDVNVAKAEGLYFRDETIDTSNTYLYTIALADTTLDSTYTVGSALIDAGTQRVIPKIENVKVDPKEYKIYVSWQSDYADLSFTSFDIYRSTQWDKDYKKINEQPVLNAHSKEDLYQDRLTFVDSIPELLKSYYYVVVGHTLFGDIGLYNVPVKAFPYPTLKAGAELSYTEIIDSTIVKLNWTYPEDKMDKLDGFIVTRAKKDAGPYVAISEKLDKSTRTFLDKNPYYNNYYNVIAFNEWGDSIRSLTRFAQIVDTDPPAMPTGLIGEIDSLGVVTLKWNPNTEDDILGYRVYSGNYAHEEFSRVTPVHVTDTVFVDTVSIKTLTRSVYYNIVAIDKRYNPSKFTAPLKIIRPDIMPPSPPVIISFDAGTEGIELVWVKSSSTDVKYHEVWRHIEKGEALELLYRGQTDEAEMRYKDTSAHAGYTYQYQIIAVDESDLKSTPAGPVTLQRTKSYLKPEIEKIKLVANSKKRLIKIGWEYNEYGIKHFLLYRAKGENKMTIYKNIPADVREFYDKDLSMNTNYAFVIKAVFEDGSESPFSEIVKETIE